LGLKICVDVSHLYALKPIKALNPKNFFSPKNRFFSPLYIISSVRSYDSRKAALMALASEADGQGWKKARFFEKKINF